MKTAADVRREAQWRRWAQGQSVAGLNKEIARQKAQRLAAAKLAKQLARGKVAAEKRAVEREAQAPMPEMLSVRLHRGG